MGKTRVQTRVDHDMNERIEAYRDDNNLSDAEAVRRLIRAGLAAKDYPVEATDGGRPVEKIASPTTVGIGLGAMLAGMISLYGAVVTPTIGITVALTALGAVFVTLATITTTAAALAQIALAEPLRDLLRFKTEVGA